MKDNFLTLSYVTEGFFGNSDDKIAQTSCSVKKGNIFCRIFSRAYEGVSVGCPRLRNRMPGNCCPLKQKHRCSLFSSDSKFPGDAGRWWSCAWFLELLSLAGDFLCPFQETEISRVEFLEAPSGPMVTSLLTFGEIPEV